MSLTILADRHIPWIDQFLKPDITLLTYQTDAELKHHLPKANALLTRTVTKINKKTFPDFPEQLSFVGSATAGTEHVDRNWLKANQITFAHSPRCNARSVAEYVATAFLIYANGDTGRLKGKKAGVIGMGHTGTRTSEILTGLGIECLPHDPPKKKRNPKFRTVKYVHALSADFLTFHVPLTETGKYPTMYMLDAHHFIGRHFELIVNASRGGVINEEALCEAKQEGKVDSIVLDVWENEPDLRFESMKFADIATPHIAGYSNQAKLEGTRMVMQSLAHHFGIRLKARKKTNPDPIEIRAEKGILRVIRDIHPIFRLDEILRRVPSRFNRIRNRFPLRDEYSRFKLLNLPSTDVETAHTLGFEIG